MLDGNNFLLWDQRIKTVLLNQYCTIVARKEFMNVGVTKIARLAHLNVAQNAVSTIPMAVSNHCVGSTTETDDAAEKCNGVKV